MRIKRRLSFPKRTLTEVAQVIQSYRSFLLACHEHPEGDAVGSIIALGFALEKLGKDVWLYSPDGVPNQYVFLPGAGRVRNNLPPPETIEVAVILDCGQLERARGVSEWLEPQHILIDIDHHQPEKAFGSIRLIEPGAPATCAIVYRLLEQLQVPVDADIATSLLTGIYVDTGSLRYDTTTSEILIIASELVAAGADPVEISINVYESRTLAGINLLGRALARAKSLSDGKVVYSLVADEDFKVTGALREDTEGMVEQLRRARDAVVAALFVQDSNSSIKVSLRSKDAVDVSKFASAHGGGGHPKAAGFNLKGALDEVIPKVLRGLQELVE